MAQNNIFQKGIKRITDLFYKRSTFADIRDQTEIYIYAGDLPNLPQYKRYIGLSINQNDRNHIHHDVMNRHELYDNSVDVYQSEDVFEHIPYESLPDVINDIYRVLKPNGVFRLSLPDYGCDILSDRSTRDSAGNIIFDEGGGGSFKNGEVIDCGHVWFPTYQLVLDLLNKTNFSNRKFYHYYNESGDPITNTIDYRIGYIKRTPDHDDRVQNPYRPMSLVVDCIK